MERKPIRLQGNWKDGYAIDIHILSSNYIGENEQGYPKFDTVRSELGELLYQTKYQNDKNKIDDIINLIVPFVSKWIEPLKIDAIISMPASDKSRSYQPVEVIAAALSDKLSVQYVNGFINKNTDIQSKNLDNKDKISQSMIRKKYFKEKVNILLIDDLFDTGASMNEAIRVLREDGNISEIYVLALTKTKGV